MSKHNTVNWFEIPTSDIKRAKKFYENVFHIKLDKYDTPNVQMYVFPYNNNNYGAAGALVHGKDLIPCKEGVTIYFHCENIEETLKNIEKNGGKILYPKMDIGENGFIAGFIDSEKNKLALHTPPKHKIKKESFLKKILKKLFK